MDLDSVLGRAVDRTATATSSTAHTVGELVAESGVAATGSATRTLERTAKSPALAAAFLILAALGGLVAMRRIFAGAIS